MANQVRLSLVRDLQENLKSKKTGVPGIGYGFIVLNNKNFGNVFENFVANMSELEELFKEKKVSVRPTFMGMCEYVQIGLQGKTTANYTIFENNIVQSGLNIELIIGWKTTNKTGRIASSKNLEETVKNRIKRLINSYFREIKKAFGPRRMYEQAGGNIVHEHGKKRAGDVLASTGGDKMAARRKLKGTRIQARILLALEKSIDDIIKAHPSVIMDGVSEFFANFFATRVEFSDQLVKKRSVKEIADVYQLFANITWDDGQTTNRKAQNSNILDNAIKQDVLKYLTSSAFQIDLKKWAEQKGLDVKDFFTASPKLEDDYLILAAQQIIKNTKGLKNTTKQKASKGTARGRTKTTGSNGTKSSRKATGLKRRGVTQGTRRTTPNSPLALRNLINKFLPQTLKSMMVSPRLVYRTGRFANSARVENIYQGSRGGYSADYTYMKNPYQTFEPGFNMGSTFRDPRSIISTAIRSIALEQMGIKFGQVRRT